jgi:hypothetical protein
MTSTAPTTVDPRLLTRVQRAALPLSTDVVQALAQQHGVCTSGIHVGLWIMGFGGVGTRKGVPDLGGCGLSRSA